MHFAATESVGYFCKIVTARGRRGNIKYGHMRPSFQIRAYRGRRKWLWERKVLHSMQIESLRGTCVYTLEIPRNGTVLQCIRKYTIKMTKMNNAEFKGANYDGKLTDFK